MLVIKRINYWSALHAIETTIVLIFGESQALVEFFVVKEYIRQNLLCVQAIQRLC